jgi:hypothetical protein
MAFKLNVTDTKKTLSDAGFVRQPHWDGEWEYIFAIPGHPLTLSAMFSANTASIRTENTAEFRSAEWFEQRESPLQLPAITFDFLQPTDRIVDVMLQYQNWYEQGSISQVYPTASA